MSGHDPKLSDELNIGSVDNDITEFKRLYTLARSRCTAKLDMENSQTLAKTRYEVGVKAPGFVVGDSVYCIEGSRCGSLDTLFEGQYDMTELKDSSTVLLKRAVPIEGRSKWDSRLVICNSYEDSLKEISSRLSCRAG